MKVYKHYWVNRWRTPYLVASINDKKIVTDPVTEVQILLETFTLLGNKQYFEHRRLRWNVFN